MENRKEKVQGEKEGECEILRRWKKEASDRKEENKLVVANAGWAETIPDWLLDEVKAERTVSALADAVGKSQETVGDAEVVAYLYTANLTAPISREMADVYLHLSAKLMKQRGMAKAEDLEELNTPKELSQDARRELDDLRRELYNKRGGRTQIGWLEELKSVLGAKPPAAEQGNRNVEVAA